MQAKAPAPVLKDPKLLRDQAYVDGAWRKADSGATFAVTNPATGQTIAEVQDLGVTETRAAIEAANAAWGPWRKKLAKERSAILRRWFNLMMENQDDLALLMTSEQGSRSPRPRARSPMPRHSSSGSPRKPSASMATPFRSTDPTSAWW